jgi:ACR3 family arsenite transporter
MACGGLIGVYSPGAAAALQGIQIYGVNGIIAALLWVLLFPMFVVLDFGSLRAVFEAPMAIALTSVVNWAVKPFTMWFLGMLFFRVLYTRVVPSEEVQKNYVAGLVLLAGAPCTAMVFVWSSLMGGSTSYTLMQVAVNDLLMLALYIPICGGLIGATNLALPWTTIAEAVGLFVAAPLLAAALVRWGVLSATGGNKQFLEEKIIAPIKPLTTIALLGMLVVIFIFQGPQLAGRTGDIFLLAVPITIQCVLMWALAYGLAWKLKIPHERAAPASLIATSNFFELAVALAVSVYGPESPAALATVVGVLVEVPIMLLFVHVCNRLKPALDARCLASAEEPTCGGVKQ